MSLEKRREKIQSKLVHPGKTLREILESSNMSNVELADRINVTPKTVSEILNGKNPITTETAIALERVFGVSSNFWNNYQKNYDKALTQLKELQKIEKEQKHLKKFSFYKILAEHGVVKKTRKRYERVKELLRFFAVDSLELIQKTEAVAYSQGVVSGKNIDREALAAWLRWGDIDAQKNNVKEFNRKKLKDSLEEIKSLTTQPVEEFQGELKSICAKSGVHVVYTPYLPRTYVNGATRWLNGENPIIQLSLRNAWIDIFWFTLFHELGHIILHGKKEEFIEFKNQDQLPQKEKEANEFAQKTLVNPDDIEDLYNKKILTRKDIHEVAKRNKISDAIVAGQVGHKYSEEGKNIWKELSGLRTRLKFDT